MELRERVTKKWMNLTSFVGSSPLRGGRKIFLRGMDTSVGTFLPHEENDIAVIGNNATRVRSGVREEREYRRSRRRGMLWRQQEAAVAHVEEEEECVESNGLTTVFSSAKNGGGVNDKKRLEALSESLEEGDEVSTTTDDPCGEEADDDDDLLGIDCLSDLALAKVFGHLSSRDLASVSLVCKRWCDLADHTRTHLKLQISNMADMESELCPDELLHRLLMRWPSLTCVEVNCVQASPLRTPGCYRSRLDFGNHTMDLLGMICGARLQELVLIECLHIDASSIATCLRRCKSLRRLHIERLNLRGCFHGAGAFACSCSIEEDLVNAISEVETLTHLWIEGCTGQITSGQLTRLLSTPNLESLALDVKMWPWPEIVMLDQGATGVGADAPGPNVVFPPGNKMKELTWISLHPMYYPNFVTLTLSCASLETLNLSCCILEAGIMGVVMRELCKGLLALRLVNCSFGGHSLLPFPEVLCPKLKELQIVGTSGAADIQCISESCPALRRLVVEEPEIMMLQERHVSCGCGLGSALYRLASRAKRALRIRSRRLATWQPGAVF